MITHTSNLFCQIIKLLDQNQVVLNKLCFAWEAIQGVQDQ